jgi:kanamycin kinase
MGIPQLYAHYAHAPEKIQVLFRAESVREIHIGCSSTSVYRIQDGDQVVYVKTHPLSPHFSFSHEHAILQWLRGQLPVPSVHAYTTDAVYEYLVLSEVPGENCVEAMSRLASDRLVKLLAQGLQHIHALDITDCPFDERIAAKLNRAQYRVHHKLVDEDDFDDERLGMRATGVYEALHRSMPPEEDLVFTHGDYCLPNILLQGEDISGFIDLDRAGISDKYNDLAIASRSIAYNLGAAYVPRFFEYYGVTTVDEEKVQYYRMMDELF